MKKKWTFARTCLCKEAAAVKGAVKGIAMKKKWTFARTCLRKEAAAVKGVTRLCHLQCPRKEAAAVKGVTRPCHLQCPCQCLHQWPRQSLHQCRAPCHLQCPRRLRAHHLLLQNRLTSRTVKLQH